MRQAALVRRSTRIAGRTLVVLGMAACAEGPTLIQGDCATVHGSEICTWGERLGDQVVAFGATIPVGAVENAPADTPMSWPPVANARIALPAAVTTATGFTLLTVFWEAHGHPPGPYLTPHFDFHFYGISAEQVDAIDCVDLGKPAELAAGYELPDVSIPEIGDLIGLCVPTMGMHSLPGDQLRSSELFEKTMVVGYDRGRPIFIEPMITAETLRRRQSFTVDLPTVPGWPAEQRYPTSFHAEYDSVGQMHRFVFSVGATTP